MTRPQLTLLLQYAPAIRSRAGSADVLEALVPLYRELSGDTSFRIKPGCRGCIEDLLNYLDLTLNAYEQQSETQKIRTPKSGHRQ